MPEAAAPRRSDCVDFTRHPYALADLSGDTVAVLDGHGIAAAHVVGTLLGAAIGQWLAVHQPARVRTLTAMAASPMGKTIPAQRGRGHWPVSRQRRTSSRPRRQNSSATCP